jgi:hypothetical protein
MQCTNLLQSGLGAVFGLLGEVVLQETEDSFVFLKELLRDSLNVERSSWCC